MRLCDIHAYDDRWHVLIRESRQEDPGIVTKTTFIESSTGRGYFWRNGPLVPDLSVRCYVPPSDSRAALVCNRKFEFPVWNDPVPRSWALGRVGAVPSPPSARSAAPHTECRRDEDEDSSSRLSDFCSLGWQVIKRESLLSSPGTRRPSEGPRCAFCPRSWVATLWKLLF